MDTSGQSGERSSSFDVVAEQIARSFHENYEQFAPEFGWEPQHEAIWENVPDSNRAVMIAVVKKLLIDNVIEPGSAIAAGRVNDVS